MLLEYISIYFFKKKFHLIFLYVFDTKFICFQMSVFTVWENKSPALENGNFVPPPSSQVPSPLKPLGEGGGGNRDDDGIAKEEGGKGGRAATLVSGFSKTDPLIFPMHRKADERESGKSTISLAKRNFIHTLIRQTYI